MFEYLKYFYLATISLLLINHRLEAQTNPIIQAHNLLTEIEFIPPEHGEKPETKGAGTRNPALLKCSVDDSEALAIMPDDNYGLTSQERPEIFVYLPKTSAKQVVLSFENQDRTEHEIAFLPIDNTAKVTSFALPEEKPPLKPGQYYQWKLTIVCGDIPHVDDPILSGWVQRQERNININYLTNKTEIEQAQWYGKNGYWYDLLKQIKQASINNTIVSSKDNIWQQLIEKY